MKKISYLMLNHKCMKSHFLIILCKIKMFNLDSVWIYDKTF